MESNTKTIAKRARVGPRTPVVSTMKKLFEIVFTPKKCLLIKISILDTLLKFWIELIKQRNDNAGEKFYLVQAFSKVRNLVEVSKILKIIEIFEKFGVIGSCSTSYPSGNQVDGSPLVAIFPMESNTKTIAKRARVGPRTLVLLTMKMLFQIMFVSDKRLEISIIILVHVLKLWIELIKQRNDNAGEKFYLMQAFSKVQILVKISKISKNLEIQEMC